MGNVPLGVGGLGTVNPFGSNNGAIFSMSGINAQTGI